MGSLGGQSGFCWNSMFPADSPFPGFPGMSWDTLSSPPGETGAGCALLGTNPLGNILGRTRGRGLRGSHPNFGEILGGSLWFSPAILGRLSEVSGVPTQIFGKTFGCPISSFGGGVSSQILGRLQQQAEPGSAAGTSRSFPGFLGNAAVTHPWGRGAGSWGTAPWHPARWHGQPGHPGWHRGSVTSWGPAPI